MSTTVDPSLRELNDCGCCEGTSVETPQPHENRPGLGAIAYRAGDWSRFRESLLARLSSSDLPALNALKTRDNDDFTIALLDAFAVMADVLTFYQERNANEAYLATATDRFSVREMARLIGYELNPGVAASVQLAFTVEDVSGGVQLQSLAAQTDPAARTVPPPSWPTLSAGTKVQSVPAPGETPQTFETIEEITARPEWNRLLPQLTTTRFPKAGETSAWLAGRPVLDPGDRLLFVGQERIDSATSTRWNFRRVVKLTTDTRNDRTRVTWDAPLSNPPAESKLFVFRQRASIFGYNAPDWVGMPNASKLAYLGLAETGTVPVKYRKEWPEYSIFSPVFPPQTKAAYTLTQQDTLDYVNAVIEAFDNTTAVVRSFASAIAVTPQELEFQAFTITVGRDFPVLTNDTIDLDQSYTKIAANTWIVLSLPNGPELYLAIEVAESSRAEFMVSGKTTRVRLSGDLAALDTRFGTEVRRTAVFAQSEQIELAPTPVLDPVSGDTITLNTAVTGLVEGRRLIVTGRRARRIRIAAGSQPLTFKPLTGTNRTVYAGQLMYAAIAPEPLTTDFKTLRWTVMLDDGTLGTIDAATGIVEYVNPAAEDAQTISEAVLLHALSPVDETHSQLQLATSLVNVYERSSVTIAANVAAATHGETVVELLGSGDAAQPFQAFDLKQIPLTYISSTAPSGASSTLSVRVNDVLWNEVPSLYAQPADARVFTTIAGEEGATRVLFGDGLQGVRLPTGRNNIRATYRKGIGLGGMVAAGQLSQLMSRPLGLKEATNPLPAEGAQDPETIDQARKNAPNKILTLDRVVSLQDYEDHARGFAGVEKALATWTWVGERNGVFLTVAGQDGAPLSPTGATMTNLIASLRELGDPRVSLQVQPFVLKAFRVRASLDVDPDYEIDKVLDAARSALVEHFRFDARDFAETVALSEVVSVLHQVDGVVAVNVIELYRTGEPVMRNSLLFAFAPRPGTTIPAAAELLVIDETGIQLEANQ